MTQPIIDVWVPGRPRTQGQLRGFPAPSARHLDPLRAALSARDNRRAYAIMRSIPVVLAHGDTDTHEAALKAWRADIRFACGSGTREPIPAGVGVALELAFVFQRPKSAPHARVVPCIRPDIDKLARAVLDALTGVLYVDDCQVTRHPDVRKRYGPEDGVRIRAWIDEVDG